MPQSPTPSPWLHRYALLVIVATGTLIYTGGLVTSIGAGMVFADWPLSNGSLNPDGWLHDAAMRAEHGHRLLASTVGLLMIGLALWVVRRDPRRWVKGLALAAVAAVVVQGLLGGLRVLGNSFALAAVHGATAQALFALLVILCWALSPWWQEQTVATAQPALDRRLGIVAALLVYTQLVVGAAMRHAQAGMAIGTWPAIDGGLLPVAWNADVAVHYGHRLGGGLLIVAAVVLLWRAKASMASPAARLAWFFTALLIGLQVLLGGMLILLGRPLVPTTGHVLLGALTLAAAVTAAVLLQRRPAPATA